MSAVFSEISSMNKKRKQSIVRTKPGRMCHNQMCRAIENCNWDGISDFRKWPKKCQAFAIMCTHCQLEETWRIPGSMKVWRSIHMITTWKNLLGWKEENKKATSLSYWFNISLNILFHFSFMYCFLTKNICSCCELRLFNFAPRRIVKENCKIKWKLLWFNCSDFNESSST